MSNASEKRKTPKQIAETIRQKELSIKRAKRDAAVLDKTFSTDSGKRSLKILMERCCYQKPVSAMGSDGKLSTENMIHNGALQGFYLWLRKQVNAKTLVSVEIEGIVEDILD